MRISHKKFILLLIILFLILYGLFQARGYLLGPQVSLENPKQGEILKDKLLIIKGRAVDVSKIYLNGRQIFTDEGGNFSEQYLLAPGVNVIRIDAEDKFGKKASIERMVSLE